MNHTYAAHKPSGVALKVNRLDAPVSYFFGEDCVDKLLLNASVLGVVDLRQSGSGKALSFSPLYCARTVTLARAN